jgi:large repetitive protein
LQNPSTPAAGTGAVTLSAKIADVSPGTGAATGKVTFYSGGTVLGTANVAGGTATLHLPKLTAGSYFLRAVFTGAGEFAGSSSAIVHYTIAAITATTLQASTAAFGQTATLKATVAVLSPGFGKANGKVTFKDGATVLGTAEVVNGVATLGVKLSTGAHHLTATYLGTTDFATSGAVALSYTVPKAAATLSLRATPNNAKAGTNITVTANAGAASPGAAGPTGTILLTDGSIIMGVGTITHGVVSLQTTKLTKGTHTLKATYSGDGNYLAETATMSLTIV